MNSSTLSVESSDSELAIRAANGDRAAFKELYQRHATELGAFLKSRMGHSVAEDLLQETWLRLWKALPTLKSFGEIRGLLFAIARNLVHDRLRSQKPVGALDEAVPPVDPRSGSPDEGLVHAERTAAIRRCLAKLAPDHAAVVQARFWEEGYEQFCQERGLSASRAHKLLFEAKQRLKTCLERALA